MLRGESSWASVDPPRPPVHRGDTTAKPEYTVVPSPLGWLKKLKDSFFGD